MKKIFVTIPWFHPAYKAGGPIQSVANMVEQFAVGRGEFAMEFSIFCSNKDLDGSFLQGVAFDEWVPYNASTKVWYSNTNNMLPVLKEEIKKQEPDYLFITGIYDWQYNFKPLLFCKGVKKIISVRGMLHPGALSQKGFKKKIYLGIWKLLGLHKKNTFHATDEAENRYIQDIFGKGVQIKIAANFPHILPVQAVQEKKPGLLKLVSIALISPMKNILLVLEALGNLCGDSEVVSHESSVVNDQSSVVNAIEYNIYGPVKDKQYWQACKALIKKLPATVSIKYHGDILPGKIAAALAACHVFILPSKSENFGHSLYEALGACRPVITSNNTPWKGLEAVKAGLNVITENSDNLVEAIRYFAVMGQGDLEEWSLAARKYALGAIDLEKIRRQYEDMFEMAKNI